jgi:hypothetical protein
MTVPQQDLPEFPALFGTAPAAAGRRVAAGVLSAVLLLGLGVGAASAVGAAAGYGRYDPWWPLLAVALTGMLALLAAAWSAATGGWLPHLLLGLRSVRTADGARPGWAGQARATLLGALGAVSLGLAPLLITLLTRDGSGRTWSDRLTGLAVIDVRRGRNILVDPVRRQELVDAFRLRPDRPAIIEVRPGGAAGPVADPGPRASDRSAGAAARPGPGVDVTRVAAPLGPAANPPGAAASGPGMVVWRLAFDTGQSHLLRGSAVLGRSPAGHPSFRGAELLRVEDPSQTVSSTHLAVVGNDLGVWVEDLGSTNGSEVIAPNGAARVLAPRVRAAVSRGSRVRLGDRLMTVERMS